MRQTSVLRLHVAALTVTFRPRTHGLFATAMAFALAIVTSARPATAAGDTKYALGWTRMAGAETCIAAGALARAAETRVGYPAWVASSAADVVIEGYVEKRATAGWHAHVVLSDAKGTVLGQRDVENEELACETLDQPLTLMLALILDPQLLVAKSPSDPRATAASNAVSNKAPPATPDDSHPPEVTPPPANRNGRTSTDVGIAIGAGLLPSLALGFVVTSTVDLGPWALEIGGAMWLPRDVNSAGSRGATLSLAEVIARACPLRSATPSFIARGCAGVEVGLVAAHGFGFDQAGASNRPAFALGLGFEGAAHLAGPLWLNLRLAGLAPLVRERFEYTDGSGQNLELFRMGAVAGTALVSLGVDFGS